MIALVVLVVTAVDAFTDGIRAKVARPYTIAAGAIADALVFYGICQTGSEAWPYLSAVAIICLVIGRYSQEATWHVLPYHKGTKWDAWHCVKRCRLYVPILILMWLAYGVGREWIWLPIAGYAVWFVSIRIARRRWSNPWGK